MVRNNLFLFGIVLLCLFSGCGLKTEIFLDPPDGKPNVVSSNIIEFEHTVQVNEAFFSGYYIFYKIFDLSSNNDINGLSDSLVADFSSQISAADIERMVNDNYIDSSNKIVYSFTIEIPNNSTDYEFRLVSQPSFSLDKLFFQSPSHSAIYPESELYRNFVNNVVKTFNPSQFVASDADLPTTLQFSSSNDIGIAFIGIAYGRNLLDQLLFSKPEYLGMMVFNGVPL